jgi:hypothetical protein
MLIDGGTEASILVSILMLLLDGTLSHLLLGRACNMVDLHPIFSIHKRFDLFGRVSIHQEVIVVIFSSHIKIDRQAVVVVGFQTRDKLQENLLVVGKIRLLSNVNVTNVTRKQNMYLHKVFPMGKSKWSKVIQAIVGVGLVVVLVGERTLEEET